MKVMALRLLATEIVHALHAATSNAGVWYCTQLNWIACISNLVSLTILGRIRRQGAAAVNLILKYLG
jgi:hypothetical protein